MKKTKSLTHSLTHSWKELRNVQEMYPNMKKTNILICVFEGIHNIYILKSKTKIIEQIR